ncbi:MAG TPA: zinc ribbon domain-containing protein [Clostridia bacterium]|nr:zinc ribbon domain-containing protein [Clostridia bacterium]
MDLYLANIIEPSNLIGLIIAIIIKSLIILYVYHDAKSHDMRRVLWIAIIIILPSYIALIAYLIIRKYNEYTNCPNCHFRVKKKTSICPNCNQILTYTCPSCNKNIKEEWDICPYCTEVLRRKK